MMFITFSVFAMKIVLHEME